MPFIRLHPLKEIETIPPEHFGLGHPARCRAERRFGAREICININQIAAYEECPLYLVCEAEPNGLINGVRIRLVDDSFWVVADDPVDEEASFAIALRQAAGGQLAEVGYSRYLTDLERRKLI